MAWPKGKLRGTRAPGAGRKKGTPNKRTAEVEELFHRYHFNPILRMITMCNEPDDIVSKDLKAGLLKELAQYVWPKRKAIEHSGSIEVHDTGVMDLSDLLTPEDLAYASGHSHTVN